MVTTRDVKLLLLCLGLATGSMACDTAETTAAPTPDTSAAPSDSTQPTAPVNPGNEVVQPTTQTAGSYIHELALDLDPTAGPDLDGDGEGNNALGAMFSEIETLMEDISVNDAWMIAITNGELSLGFLWPGLDTSTLPNPIGFQVFVVDLQDPDGDPSTTDAYTVPVPPGTSTPGTPFPGATIVSGTLAAGPTPLLVSFPYYGVTLDLDITQTRASGTVTTDALGVAVPDGTFTGVVDMSAIANWANAFVVSEACSCLAGSGTLIDLSYGFTTDACVGMDNYDTAACTGETGPYIQMCKFFVDGCIIVVPLLSVHADIDTDGDGKSDSHSAVIHFKARGTKIDLQ